MTGCCTRSLTSQLSAWKITKLVIVYALGMKATSTFTNSITYFKAYSIVSFCGTARPDNHYDINELGNNGRRTGKILTKVKKRK